jgi:hypothetical protein
VDVCDLHGLGLLEPHLLSGAPSVVFCGRWWCIGWLQSNLDGDGRPLWEREMARVAKEKLPVLKPKGKTIVELAKELKVATAKAKKYEALMNQHKSLVHKIRVFKLPPLLEDIEGDGINLPGVGYVETDIEIYPSVKKSDESDFHDWLRKNKLGGIIVDYIHFKTLQATVKEQLIAGTNFPEYVNIAKVPTATLKAEKKSAKKKR